MTNTITTFNSNREAPWVGIGVSGQWTDFRHALHDAQLDFEVEAKDAKVEVDLSPSHWLTTVRYDTVPGVQVNMVKDSDKILGCVSNQYGIVQNEQAFSMLEPFTQAGGIITNAGMTEQGLVFMVLRMRREVINGEDWNFDVMCTNSFNGSFPCALMMVPTRIICQNMYRKLMGGNSDSLLHIRHGRMAPDRLDAAAKVTGNVLNYVSTFGATLGMARNKPLSASTIEAALVPMLFPYPKPGGDRYETSKDRVDKLREEFMVRYYDAHDNRRYHGTGLGFINAYYDYLSHRDPGKCMPGSWQDRRLSGLVSGNDVKVSVIKEAM